MTRETIRASASHGVQTPFDDALPSVVGPCIAGYRVLRRVPDRHGGRVLHVAVDDASGSRTSATMVVFAGDDGDALAMRLVERLETLGGESVPRVLDVCLSDDGDPAVVLDFCGDFLSSMLASGRSVSGGEVVTLAAPILSALLGIHDRGFVHGGVSSASIAIGSNGRPVLIGCERADDLRGHRDRGERTRRAGEDLRAFADLVDDLGGAVVDESERRRVRAAAEKLREGSAAPFSSSFRSAAEVRLFEIAEPTPLAFAEETEPPRGASSKRLTRSLVSPGTTRRRQRAASSAHVDARHVVALTARSAARTVASARSAASRAIGWVRSGGRRRRILIAAASGAAAALALVLVIPSGEPVAGRSASVEGSTGEPAPVATDEPSETASGPTPSGEQGADTTTPDEGDEDAIAGTRGVLDAVARCAVDQADSCWAAVFEPDSVLLSAVVDGGSGELPAVLLLPVEALDIEEKEDFGDARLIVVTPGGDTRPASVLMVRTEAGWRIRDVFET